MRAGRVPEQGPNSVPGSIGYRIRTFLDLCVNRGHGAYGVILTRLAQWLVHREEGCVFAVRFLV